MYLTRRQRDVFHYIRQFIRKNGYSPTLEEICKGVGLSSLSSVHKHLKNLEAKGVIARRCNRARSIEILKDYDFMGEVDLRVLGEISAGRPIAAAEKGRTLKVSQELLRGQDSFILRVRDDSFREEMFLPGDCLIVERRNVAENGELIVALLKTGVVLVRRYIKDGEGVRLESTNDNLTPIVLPAGEIQVRGVITGLLRRY
jgi:repressor LexA